MPRRSGLSRRLREFAAADLLLPGYLALALLLGGSSYGGWAPNALVELVGLVALAWIGADRERRGAAAVGRALGALVLVYLLWTAATLVPLPPGWWDAGAARGGLARDYAALGMAVPARPLSLDPERTVAGMLSIVPFVAALAITLGASDRARGAGAGVALGVALLSIPLGALQLLGGEGSPWYLYSPTNVGNTVGFFANANHLATLFLMVAPLVAALAARARGAGERRAVLGEWPLAGAFACVLFGLVLDGSVAGLLLAAPSAFGAALVYRRGIGRPVPARLVAAAAAMIAVAVLFLVFGPMHRLLLQQALAAGTDPTTRETSMRLTARAAADFFPLGSGLGSFRWVYPAYEDARTVTIEFNVHAHNDYLELLLELGAAGAVLIAGSIAWVAWRTAAVWSGREAKGSLARAASVGLAMLLLHSLVDFPGRTAAIAALAGYAAALLQAPRPRTARARREEDAPPAPPIAPARHLEI